MPKVFSRSQQGVAGYPKEGNEMTCTSCGIPYLGLALDGTPRCHKRECVDWKHELQQHRNRTAQGWKPVFAREYAA